MHQLPNIVCLKSEKLSLAILKDYQDWQKFYLLAKRAKLAEILSNLLLIISIDLPNGATCFAGEPAF